MAHKKEIELQRRTQTDKRKRERERERERMVKMCLRVIRCTYYLCSLQIFLAPSTLEALK